MPDASLALILGLVVLLVLVVRWLAKSVRTVPEGYVSVLQWMDRHSRVVESGPYLLRPFEEEATRLLVRQREVRSLGIPNIFTHGGLPLTIMLDFEMHLDPRQMSRDELYYEEFMREDQMVRILKGILLDLVASAPRPQERGDPNRVDVALLFSPFFTGTAQIRDGLAQHALPRLARHGIEISEGSLLISWLKIPDTIITAYTDALAKGFSGAAEHELIQRLRNAGTGMSDVGLVHLVNALRDNPAELNTIFTSGGFPPDIRVQAGHALVQAPGADTPRTSPPPTAPDQTQTPNGEPRQNDTPDDDSDDLPLTPEDMALLRSVMD